MIYAMRARRTRPSKHPGVRLFGVIVALTLYSLARAAQVQVAGEYQLKAAFLFNFAKFVEWPPKVLPPSRPIALCILGTDPFGLELERTIKDERVAGRELAIRRLKQVQERDTCHVLFISPSEKDSLSQILAALKNSNVLTISEIEGFTQVGGIINFYIEESKIRFEINVGAAEKAGLKISSKLLKLAKITQ